MTAAYLDALVQIDEYIQTDGGRTEFEQVDDVKRLLFGGEFAESGVQSG